MAASAAGAKVTEKVGGLTGREGGLVRLRRATLQAAEAPRMETKRWMRLEDRRIKQATEIDGPIRETGGQHFGGHFRARITLCQCFEANRRFRYMKFSLTV